jgi:NADPH-dependent 2,4-dienoyl-CoA reductase/sulfur reductase-like enzyme
MKLIVIGGNPAGLSCASAVKSAKPDWDVVVYEMGDYISYGSCGLPYLVGGLVEKPENLITLTKETMLKERKVVVFTNHKVTSVDFNKRLINVQNIQDSSQIIDNYDYLMIATGAKARIPAVLHIKHPNVFHIHTIDDANHVRQIVQQKKFQSGIIIGSGYIGLEMIEAYLSLGVKDLTVIGLLLFPNSTQKAILKELENHGIKYINKMVVDLKSNKDKEGQLQVELEGGTNLETNFVQISVGVEPNTDIFRTDPNNPLHLAKENGAIIVDEFMRTNIPNVYAGGDCATVYHRLLKKNVYIPLATTANKQGRVAGNHISGKGSDPFAGVIGTVAFKVLDLYCARTGLTVEQAKEMGYIADSVQIENNDIAHYYPNNYPNKPSIFQEKINITLVFDVVSHLLLGAEITAPSALGGKKIDVLVTAISSGMKIEDIQQLDLAYAPPFAPVWDPILIAVNIARKKLK